MAGGTVGGRDEKRESNLIELFFSCSFVTNALIQCLFNSQMWSVLNCLTDHHSCHISATAACLEISDVIWYM